MINVAADVAAIVGTTAEFGETATIAGESFAVIGVQPFQGAQLGDISVEGNRTILYTPDAELAAVSGAIGSSVVFRGVTYTLARIERREGGLTVIELQR